MPRGHALGMVSQVPEKDEYSVTKQQVGVDVECSGVGWKVRLGVGFHIWSVQ